MSIVTSLKCPPLLAIKLFRRIVRRSGLVHEIVSESVKDKASYKEAFLLKITFKCVVVL